MNFVLVAVAVCVVVGLVLAITKFRTPKAEVKTPVVSNGLKISVLGPKMSGKSELIGLVGGKKISENVYQVTYDRKTYEVHEKVEENVTGVVFVVDASNVKSSVDEWNKVKDTIKGLPTVILANKNDIAGAKSYADISTALDIDALLLNGEEPNTEWPINMYMTSVKANFGFIPGLKWLAEAITDFKKHK